MAAEPHPVPPVAAAPLDLDVVAAIVAEQVACDDVLAPLIAPDDASSRPRQLADLLRRAASAAADGAAGPGAAASDGPAAGRAPLVLDHAAYSLLASHVADVLDAIAADEPAAADLLAGLAAVRRVVVRPTAASAGPDVA